MNWTRHKEEVKELIRILEENLEKAKIEYKKAVFQELLEKTRKQG